MKKIILLYVTVAICGAMITSCTNNNAAEAKPKHTKIKETEVPVKKDSVSIAAIETAAYTMKVHRAFVFKPEESEVLTGMKPKEGYKFVYLDLSIRNKGTAIVDGGALFVSLKVLDENGVEYKKPATALAAYNTAHPEDSNSKEYSAMWGKLKPNEFHREVFCAVEVPESVHKFTVSMPFVAMSEMYEEIEITF